jgi:hypothetical protein
MRILTRDRVLFTGQHLCPEFDCPRELPDQLKILLCLVDGATGVGIFKPSSTHAAQPGAERS